MSCVVVTVWIDTGAWTMRTKQSVGYTAYGFTRAKGLDISMLRFNGQYLSEPLGSYVLGNGQRCFSPAVFRFISPDRASPFGEGGINAYGYCLGDPINRTDPSGHVPTRPRGNPNAKQRPIMLPAPEKSLEVASVKQDALSKAWVNEYNRIGIQTVENTLSGQTGANKNLYKRQHQLVDLMRDTFEKRGAQSSRAIVTGPRETTPFIDALLSVSPLPPPVPIADRPIHRLSEGNARIRMSGQAADHKNTPVTSSEKAALAGIQVITSRPNDWM